MTPDQFTSNASAWTAAIEHVATAAFTALVAIGIAGAAAYVRLKPYFDKIKADIETNKAAALENSQRIDAHDKLKGVQTVPPVTVIPLQPQQPSQPTKL